MTERAWWRRALVWGAYPALVFGSMGVMLYGIRQAWLAPEWMGSAVVLAVSLLIVILEQAVPDRPGRVTPRTVWVDLLHNVVSSGGPSYLVRAAAFGVAVALGAASSRAVGLGLWPGGQSLVVQTILALVIGELGVYWAHRLMHASAPLWRVHALHHSPEHLYFLASARSHPINAVLTHALQVAPAILLGAGVEVIALASAFTAITGILQHCNAEMRTEWLNWLVATPDLHRTHHSTEMEESNANYGNNLILWDIVFGTWLPGRRPAQYGVSGVDWPESYLGQLATPLTYDRLAGTEPEPAAVEPEPEPEPLATQLS